MAYELGEHFVLQKIISNKLYDRSVYIANDNALGKCIFIKSYDDSFKEKNKIPLFISDPIKSTTITINNSVYNSVEIERHNTASVKLTSKTPVLLELFKTRAQQIIIETNQLHHYLNKWATCLLNSMARCVQILQIKRKFIEQSKITENEQTSEINKVSLSRAIISIRYLAHLLENGTIGYLNLKRSFFKIWLTNWNTSSIRNVLRVKHKEVQNKVKFFDGPKQKQNVSKRYRTNIHDIHEKLEGVNAEFNRIYKNMGNTIRTTPITESVQTDSVNNLQQIADLRHRIETINNTGEEFIIIGDQSSGKSSLLCMLLGVNIAYTDSLFATRCPVRYLLEPCDAKMGWKFEFEEPTTKQFTSVSQDELQRKLLTHFKGTIGKQIVFEPISIKIWSPTCTSSMTLVDLPGLVGNGDTTEKQSQHETSYAIVKDYLKKENIFILFVHRFDVDIGSLNTSILDEVKNRNKNNVIYCLTHFDRCCSDTEITYDNIYNNILECSSEIANGNDMFLLSLSKMVTDLKEKETISANTIKFLKDTYGDILQQRNIHFNLDSVKIFMRKKLHRHVLEFNTVLQEFIFKQKDIMTCEFNIYNNKFMSPKINEEILEQFNHNFKNNTQKLLKGHLIPHKRQTEHTFFENLKEEVKSANIFAKKNNTNIWPSISMLRKNIAESKKQCSDDTPSLDISGDETHSDDIDKSSSTNNITYDSELDICLTRDLISHALYTRTVYELQQRLCSISVKPSMEDIIHGITYDPNINLDTPTDSAHCVMLHTVKQQLNMNLFFDYAIRRFEYITYKIFRYSIWNMLNTPNSDNQYMTLMDNEDFQQIFEIETYKYVEKLCDYTREKFTSSFDEIMNSPIVISHADRYRKMLINDFEWEEKDIDACNSEDIFKPKNVGVHSKKSGSDLQSEDDLRVKKICNLIKLHIHVRLLKMCEVMTMHIDFNWRRMLDDSKDSSNQSNPVIKNSIFEHIRLNVCKIVVINDTHYNMGQLLKIYNGCAECKIEIDQKKVDDIEHILEMMDDKNSKIPEILGQSVIIAGDKFL